MNARSVWAASRARYEPSSRAAARSTGLPQPGLELPPVLRSRDDDRHAAAAQCSQQVAGHPFGQFLVATVELNDVTTDVQVFSPNHRFSMW